MDARVKISDVAAAAGVSITTVSHALNGKGRLTADTRQRVRDVADRLGYRPSVLARGLAGGRSGMLALTVSAVGDSPVTFGDYDYFMRVMNGATSAAFERGFSLTLVASDSRAEVLRRLPLDGVVVIDPVLGDATVDLLDQLGVPVVTTGRRPSGPADAYWVDNDHIAGTRAMIEHLVATGATRIALLNVPPLQSFAIDAVQTFEKTCAELGLEGLIETVTESISETGGYAAASRLLESSNRPDAIYVTLDCLGRGAILAAKAHGLRLPDDIRIASCTDSHAAEASKPPLTALSLNPEEIGQQAVDLLVTVVEDGATTQPQRVVPSSIVIRSSTQRIRNTPPRRAARRRPAALRH